MKARGIEVELSTLQPNHLFADNEDRRQESGPLAFGLVWRFWAWGDLIRPIPHPRTWFRKDAPSVWFSAENLPWKVWCVSIPPWYSPAALLATGSLLASWSPWALCLLPLLSPLYAGFLGVILGRFRAYVGLKDAGWDETYARWLNVHREERSGRFLTPSVTLRRGTPR